MRLYSAFAALLLLCSTAARGQSPPAPPPNPSPQTKATPQAQPPVQTQYYRLVPVDAAPVQQPQYQTVQVVQQPQYQTVQLAPQPVQQAVYTTGMTATLGVAPVRNNTVVLGPGLVGLSLARTGQFLTNTFGKSHVWQISHTTVAPQIQPAPPVQLVSVSLPNPVVQQPVYVNVPAPPQQQVLINAPSEAAPPPPVVPTYKATPSPQSSTVPPPKHHSLFGMLGN